MGKNETVEHVIVLECVKSVRNRDERTQGVVSGLGHVRVKTGREWMLLLRLCRTSRGKC